MTERIIIPNEIEETVCDNGIIISEPKILPMLMETSRQAYPTMGESSKPLETIRVMEFTTSVFIKK